VSVSRAVASATVPFGGSRPHRLGRRRRSARGRRGVSDVIATILILALTVVLFASLFAFVSAFPSAPAQDVNQFQASVINTVTTGSGTYCGPSGTTKLSSTGVCGVTILQDGGPTVPNSDRVYLASTRSSTNWQFSQASGVFVGWGDGNASGGWQTGQYWTELFATPIKVPTNITIYIVSATQLLYSGVVPGASPNLPPVLTSAYTVPATPAVGAAFQVVALVSGNVVNLSVNISLSEIPGLPSAVKTMAPNGTGEWVYNVSSGLTTTNGTYLAFIQGVNASGATISGSVSVTLTSTGGGGSSPSASVTISPGPPTVRTNTTLAASITNPTAAALTVSNVTYYVNVSAANHTALVTLYPPHGTALPTIAAHSSNAVTSAVWMAPPKALGAVNLTAVVTFSSGAHAVAASAATFGVAPFTATISVFSQNQTMKTNGTWDILVSVENFGTLGNDAVNVTVYVNNTTGAKSPVGSVYSPAGTKGGSTGTGYATLAGSTLGPESTSTFVAQWTLGGHSARGPSTLTVQVLVVIKNTAYWATFTTTSLTLTSKTTPPVLTAQFTT